MKYARLDGAVPLHTVLTHLYASCDTYTAIPKPQRFKTFYIVRDPRVAVVSGLSLARIGRPWHGMAVISHQRVIDPPQRERLGTGKIRSIARSVA